jgi:hypothetical protein
MTTTVSELDDLLFLLTFLFDALLMTRVFWFAGMVDVQ